MSGRGRRRATIAVRLTLELCAWVGIAACGGCFHSLDGDRTQYHVVRKGETLYQIAWLHRLDQRDLARWNGLADPDMIRVGQRLRLTAPRAALARVPPAPAAARSRGRAAAPLEPAKSRTEAAPPAAPAPPWLWPTDGAVATRFGAADGIASGIGIAGSAGQPVKAAAAGRVVYAGAGLIGYGLLVIIKHNDTYLSAYGYLSELRVHDGDDVARGQTIALMGLGPGRRPRLHFEIRRNGTPVDPLLLVSAGR